MTKTKFRKKVRELKRVVNKLIEEKMEKVLASGCMALEDAEDNFRLPKNFMVAIGKEIEWHYEPITKKDTRESNNIYRHM